jgi:hypothetical protein
MKRILLISIRPEWLYLILLGKKTLEIRKVVPKWVLEAIDRGEEVIVYWYCTKGNPHPDNNYFFDGIKLNGRIVARSVLRKIDVIYHDDSVVRTKYMLNKACLTYEQLETYGNGKDLYALHIEDLTTVDMGLGEFISDNKSYNECPFAMSLAEEYMTAEEILLNRGGKIITRPPQNMQVAWVREEKK